MSTLLRRLITVPLCLALTVLMLASLPLWLPVSIVAALLLPAARAAPRCLGFITAYLVCESIGVVVAGLIWMRYRLLPGMDAAGFIDANYRLQHWWAGALKRCTETLFALHFEVEGLDALDGDGAILLPRHTSIGDTVVPMVFYATPCHKRMRYVLKRELLLDPCLDIVGNRLPNCFVDRFSDDVGREVSRLRGLLDDLGPDDAVLIYPEGTRFSPRKRMQILEALAAKGDAETLARAEHWTHLLPPRPAGTIGLLEGNPDRDLLLCAHSGFEGSSSFATLFNGSWVRSRVRIRFWRIPHDDIPRERTALRAFLLDLWDEMERQVADLSGTAPKT